VIQVILMSKQTDRTNGFKKKMFFKENFKVVAENENQ
jgi:hypothetical protein